MDEHALREYVTRGWQEAAVAKAAYWAERFAEDRQATWEAAQALLAHARRVQPAFPTDSERDADFRDHVRWRDRLDRAADALARR